MGLFWDLLQQSQISDQQNAASSLEQRVVSLEEKLHRTQALQRLLIEKLEEHFGEDIDGDQKIGRSN